MTEIVTIAILLLAIGCVAGYLLRNGICCGCKRCPSRDLCAKRKRRIVRSGSKDKRP